jgi:hypothetical protein
MWNLMRNRSSKSRDISPEITSLSRIRSSAEAKELLRRFDPRRVGFGIDDFQRSDFTGDEKPNAGRQPSPNKVEESKVNASKLSLVPLQMASLCLDCEMITATNGRCVACGSVALLSVARTLSRPGRIELGETDHPAASRMATNRSPQYGDFLHST